MLTLAHEREYCALLLRRVAEEYGMRIESIEVDEDHVHLYIAIPPQMSVGKGAGVLKSVSARMMFKRFNYLRRKLWAGSLWSSSYFVRTVGEGVTAAMVRSYIMEHSAKGLEPAQGKLFPTHETKLRSRKLPRSP